jgi:hypothetical protein
MGADEQLLQGEINESLDRKEIDVEAMLMGFIQALLEEQSDESLSTTLESGNA